MVPVTNQRISCIFFGGSSSAPGYFGGFGGGRPDSNGQGGTTLSHQSFGSGTLKTRWWCTYPYEKWWSSSVGVITAKIWTNKIHVPNHQPEKVTMFPVAKFIFPSPSLLGPRPKFQAWTFKTSLSLPTSQGKPRGWAGCHWLLPPFSHWLVLC